MVDYTAFIQEKTRDFTGRRWVFRTLSAWLQESGPQMFLLTGKPGSGKSAIAARLVQMSHGDVPLDTADNLRRDSLAFYHFCQARNDPTLDPLRFVESLSVHLANRYPLFASALLNVGEQGVNITVDQRDTIVADEGHITGVIISSLHIGNVSARIAFDRIVRKPLEHLCGSGFDEQIVILVDSLDEALTYGDETITRLLGDVLDNARTLPSQVRWILTSRVDPRVAHLVGAANLDLVADAPEDIDDVYEYIQHRIERVPAAQREQLARRISNVSKGNFLYAYHVTAHLLSNVEQVEDLNNLPLPKDLYNVYRQFLKRELAHNLEVWGERYQPLLSAIAVARAPGLMCEQLAGITGLSPSRVSALLLACNQYLSGPYPEGPFRIYHQSFRDFLLVDQKYRVYPADANQAVARFFLAEYGTDWLDCDDTYALRYVPRHLIDAMRSSMRHEHQKLMDDLARLLTNLTFLEGKTRYLGVDEVMTDLHAAVQLIPPERGHHWKLQAALRVLDLESHKLRSWSRKQPPVFFAQQIYNQAVRLGLPHLAHSAAVRLAQLRHSYLKLQWCISQESPALERNLIGHEAPVLAIAVSGDGNLAVSAYDDGLLKVWNLRSGQEVHNLVGHEPESWILDVTITPDGRRAISASSDCTLKIWDLDTGHELHTLVGHKDYVRSVAVTPDGSRAISASADQTLKVWSLETFEPLLTMDGHEDWVNDVTVIGKGDHAISCSRDGTLIQWDISTGEIVRRFPGHASEVVSVAATLDGPKLISVSTDGVLKAWNLEQGKEIYSLIGFEIMAFGGRPVKSADGDAQMEHFYLPLVAITPDGRNVVSVSEDHVTLTVRELDSGCELYRLPGHGLTVRAIAVAPDGHCALSGSNDGVIKVWNLQAKDVTRQPIGHRGQVNRVAFSNDSRYAFSASHDNTIKIWDVQTGQEVDTLSGHKGPVWLLKTTPDGQSLISASFDRTVVSAQ